MKEALADVGRRGPWNEEQRRALRSAFQALVDAFENVLVLRGKRVSIGGIVVASAGALDVSLDCPFKPKSVLVLGATSASGSTLVSPTVVWAWTATSTSGTLRLTDPLSSVPDDTYTFNIFMEKG